MSFVKVLLKRISRFFPDKMYLRILYRMHLHKSISFSNPKAFTEKLQWIKLYDRNPLYSLLVDKYLVKDYVAKSIGTEYVIPLLGVWDRFDDIDFNNLPNQFVLKCTHDSAGLVICHDKATFNIPEAKKRINKSMKNNFYYEAREWPYKNVKPRIIAEKYMEDEATKELRDYKFFCFNGEVKAMFIASDRFSKNSETKFDFFDPGFNHLPIRNGHPNSEVLPNKPTHFEEMIRLAEKLSRGIPHVRCDFYEVNGHVYFGEFTFFHFAGLMSFEPKEWDDIFGSWIELPEKK